VWTCTSTLTGLCGAEKNCQRWQLLAPGAEAQQRIDDIEIGLTELAPNWPGLRVDQNGNMSLEQLMATWARREGMQEQDVLSVVQENMFHEDGQLRFSIGADSSGRTKIRVLPKRDK
jgi:hypothetical protein